MGSMILVDAEYAESSRRLQTQLSIAFSSDSQVGDALFKDALAMVQLEVSRKPVEHALYCWKRAIRLELNHRVARTHY